MIDFSFSSRPQYPHLTLRPTSCDQMSHFRRHWFTFEHVPPCHLSEDTSWHFLLCRSPAMMPSNYLILLLPSILSNIRVILVESSLHIRWPKYWSFSFSISPSNEYSELISFRIDCLGLLAVQGTLKSLPKMFLWHGTLRG